jgi:hypothetical protein
MVFARPPDLPLMDDHDLTRVRALDVGIVQDPFVVVVDLPLAFVKLHSTISFFCLERKPYSAAGPTQYIAGGDTSPEKLELAERGSRWQRDRGATVPCLWGSGPSRASGGRGVAGPGAPLDAAHLLDVLAKPDQRFEEAALYVLAKNEELYRRLA